MLGTGKVIGIIAGTGLVGTASAVSYVYATSGTTIEELIKGDKKTRTILTKDTFQKEGERAWKSYKEKNPDKTKGKDIWKLNNWQWVQEAQNMPQNLFDKCEEQKYKKIKGRNDKLYLEFVDWCTKEG